MNSDQDSASTKLSHDISTDNVTVKVDKKEKKSDTEDPKPRIVLTFRSEKPGAKSSNMKIVSTEEKHEEISPRRSNRTRNQKWDSDDDNEAVMSPKKDTMSDNDEASDNSQAPLKRSTRRRSREADSVLASAIARKEKSYNETTVTSQRPSRRIKPTAKVLANKELHKEALNKGDSSQEGGVRTRRSTRRTSVEKVLSKTSYDTAQGDEEAQNDNSEKPQSNKKLKHLCELGLKAIDSNNDDRDEDLDDEEDEQEESNDTELDDEPDIINKLIEEDSGSESSDEEFYCSTGASRSKRPRRSTRLCSSYGGNDSEDPPSPAADDEQKTRSRRTSRRWKKSSAFFDEEFDSNTAAGEEGAEATCPEDESKIIATCFCESNSTIHAAPDDLPETVFCKAVETVDGSRVGCSHGAQRSEGGELGPLVRAGPRSPFLLACKLHNMQLRKHMCCPACGLFCTQGFFYQCSEGHLFHLECGLPYNDAKQRPGCPHCGVYSYRWQPVNCECVKVKLEMKCTNKRIYLPDQRVQCTPAYLGFSTLEPSQLDEEPIIPEDLLPPSTLDLEKLYVKRDTIDYEEMLTNTPEERLCEAIIAGEEIEQLVPKILSCSSSLGSAVHSAAVHGRLKALWALRRAGADLDARDAQGRTPLIATLLALLDKPEKKKDKETTLEDTKMEVTKNEEEAVEEKVNVEVEHSSEVPDELQKEIADEDLIRVIRYLVAAGCDVNAQGPEGVSALHVAAQYGSADACKVLLSSGRARVDLRDHGGWTPLVWAAENKHARAVRVLLAAGADAAVADSEGNAAVHWCALAGDAHSLRLLLDAAPHVLHHTNAHADTPLHVAARQGHYACVVILLARGAQTNVENASGEIPAQVCAEGEAGEECRRAIAVNSLMADAFAPRRFRLLASDISRGREPFPVPCVNEIDDTPLPKDFTYVTRHVMPQQVPIDDTIETMQGCACDGDAACGTRGSACACGALSVRVWAHDGCLLPTFPYRDPPMLFECNQTCACDLRVCDNMLVSRALSAGSLACRAAVFRTFGGRGWGLRALQRVRRGAPVAAYCGELLTAAAADSRPTDHYMFALDLKPDLREQCESRGELCVDAARYGSAARFVNHSCRPNLTPVRVFTHARDLRLPIVTLFALTDIQPGDELTFDYGDKFWSVKSKWMKCECGTPECRYPTKATSDSE